MADSLIQIVDEHNNPVGSATKQQAWHDSLWHQVVHVSVFSPDGKLLVQRRAATKHPFPLCLEHSMSGHVDAGEDYEAAARREVKEELGLDAGPLAFVGEFPFFYESPDWGHIRRFDRVYKITVPDETVFTLPPDEVAEVRWMHIADLKARMQAEPDTFTPAFREIVRRYY